MQRYRVNYGLLVGLLVGSIVLGGGVYLLHSVQKSRNADGLLRQAEEAESEGDLRGVRSFLFQYLSLRPDDVDAARRLANVQADIGEQSDAEPSEWSQAVFALENFVSANPTETEARRRVTDLLVKRRQWNTAMTHINYLLNEDPNNAELQRMRLTGLLAGANSAEAIKHGFKLVGYDSVAGEFDADNAKTPNDSQVYLQLAIAVCDKQSDPETGDAIMEQLLAVNPESAEAHLANSRYLERYDRDEASKEMVDKAFELDPENVEVLLAKGQSLMKEGVDLQKEDDSDEQKEAANAFYDRAYDLLQKASELAANDFRVYEFLSRLERHRRNPDAMISHYDRGIKEVDRLGAIQLRINKARAQIDLSDIDGARETIQEMADEGTINQAVIDYLNARIDTVENRWFKASETFTRVQPFFSRFPDLGLELNIYLGLCLERLGQHERALEAYEQVLQVSPEHPIASSGRDRMRGFLGERPESANQNQLDRMIVQELRKPEEEQNWDPILAEIDELAKRPGVVPYAADLLRAGLFSQRGMHQEALAAVKRALDASDGDLRVSRQVLRIVAADPERGPAEALKRLDTVVKQHGDSALLRVDRADFLRRLGGEDLPGQLLSVADGTESWEASKQVQLWKGLARQFLLLRDDASRQVCLQKVAELAPNELPTLLELFNNAIKENDDEQIFAAQDRILRLVGSKENATYLYTEARRLIWGVARGADRGDLDKADRLVERALVARPDWHLLFELQAQLALNRRDKGAAIAAYEKAFGKGRANPLSLVYYIPLLLEKGRYVDAAKVLEKFDKPVRQALLGRRYAEILLNSGALDEAVESAAQAVAANPELGAVQLWHGRFLMQASASPKLAEDKKQTLLEGAGAALATAVEKSPGNTEAWLSLVQYLVSQERPLEAEDALRRAQLALPEDQQELIVGQGLAWLRRWFDAENIFKRALEEDPENLGKAQLLANFYLGPLYQRDDRWDKASPLINQILSAAAADEGVAAGANALWARRKAAERLASSGEYGKLLDAERLLEGNQVGGELNVTDKLMMARILSGRPEPSSRLKAISQYEDVRRNRNLNLDDELRLGRMYYLTGNWEACQRQMEETISRNRSSAAARATYIEMLLQRGDETDLGKASRQVSRLQAVAPQNALTLQLFARVAVRLDKQRQARTAINKLLPRDLSKASPELLVSRAALLVQLEDLDGAERLFRAAAKKKPTEKLRLAQFLGVKRDPDLGFDMLEGLEDEFGLTEIVNSGLAIVRANRSVSGDRFDGRVRRWLEKALREDPESIPNQLQQAALLEIERDFDGSAEVYRKLLKLPELEGEQRAAVLNNLGYLLATSARSDAVAEEAMGYVAEAIDILGPQSDILDTRAVVHLALGQFDSAVSDLSLAITDRPSSSKYYHKSRAHMLAGDIGQALSDWEQAVSLGLTRDSIAIGEQEQYDQLREKLERIGN